MLILVAFLIEILYVKASSKYFYNLTNTIIKQRKLQRFASLKKEEKNWNFEEMEKQSKGSLWKWISGNKYIWEVVAKCNLSTAGVRRMGCQSC